MARWLDVTMTCALSNGSTFLASNWIPNPRANGTALVVEATDLQLWNPKPSSLRSWSGTIRKRKRKPDALRLRPPTTRKSGIVRIRGARSISDKKEYITSASNAFFVVVSLLIFSIVFFFNSKNQYMTFDLYIDQFFPSSSYDNLRGTLWEFQLIRFFWQRSDLYDWGRRVGHRTIAEARSSRISSQCVVSPNYLNTKKTAAFLAGFLYYFFFFFGRATSFVSSKQLLWWGKTGRRTMYLQKSYVWVFSMSTLTSHDWQKRGSKQKIEFTSNQ